MILPDGARIEKISQIAGLISNAGGHMVAGKHCRHSYEIRDKKIIHNRREPLLFAGCSTLNDRTEWEYKLALPTDRSSVAALETFVNDLAQEGWILIQKEPDGLFIFKRAKK